VAATVETDRSTAAKTDDCGIVVSGGSRIDERMEAESVHSAYRASGVAWLTKPHQRAQADEEACQAEQGDMGLNLVLDRMLSSANPSSHACLRSITRR
jgi:hypothetical protein